MTLLQAKIGRGAGCTGAAVAFLLACVGEPRFAPPPEGWEQRASLPDGPLHGAVSFSINDRLYVGTGLRSGGTNAFYSYDPARDTWTKAASLPANRRAYATGLAIGGFGYVGLGSNCVGEGLCTFQYFNDWWRYDPRSDTWARLADFPGTARGFASSFVVGGRAYVVGGGRGDQNDVWEYEPSADSWKRKADYPGRCNGRGSAFSAGGRGYVGLGYSDGPCNDFWRYDAAADSWTAVATFPGVPRWDAAGFSVEDVAFVAGGGQEPMYRLDIWTYHPAGDTWSELPTVLPGAGRSQMIAGIVDGRVFLGLGTKNEGGGPATAYDDLWEYVADE